MVRVGAAIVASVLAVSGGWRLLAPAPIAPSGYLASAWTGSELFAFGRDASGDVAAAYGPAQRRWRRLTPPAGSGGAYNGGYSAVWTGREVLVWGPFDVLAYNPRTDAWRTPPRAPGIQHAPGLAVWTGRELIGWGGGCCGDAFSDGEAYNPEANRWRSLARSPLAGSQHPIGAWTGRELIVFVSGFDPDGKPWPARLARAAAYNPSSNRWRRLAPQPASRFGATAAWDGREVLVVGGGTAKAYAFDPAKNRWRVLAPAPAPIARATAVWTGKRLLVWSAGLAYDPVANRWSRLPPAPVNAESGATAVWTGRALLVWDGRSLHALDSHAQ
jgi:hypothetical protein